MQFSLSQIALAYIEACKRLAATTYPSPFECLSLVETFAHNALGCLQRCSRVNVVSVDGCQVLHHHFAVVRPAMTQDSVKDHNNTYDMLT